MSDFSKVKYKKRLLLSKNVREPGSDTDWIPRSRADRLRPAFASGVTYDIILTEIFVEIWLQIIEYPCNVPLTKHVD